MTHLRTPSANADTSARAVVRAYSLLAFGSLTFFGLLHVLDGSDVVGGWLEVAGGFAFLLNAITLRLTRNTGLAIKLFQSAVFAFLMLMLERGGTHGTGELWFFVFPVSAFFLTGKRRGLWWLAALVAATIVMWLLQARGLVQLAYDGTTIRQLLVSLAVVSLGIYVYQSARERLENQNQESQTALRNEQIRAELIVQHIGEGIVAAGMDGRVTFMNQSAETLLGWKAGDLLGQSFVDKVPMIDTSGQEVPAKSRPLMRALQTGESNVTVATYRRKDGSTLPISATSTPMQVDGRYIGVIATFRDISEERNVARTKSEFVTIASHQLRTPISAISWLSELLLGGDSGALNAEQRKHVEDIYKSNRRMASLVNEMLIVSSLELGTLPVNPEPTDLAAVAKQIIKEQQDLQTAAKPHITQTFGRDMPKLDCDPDVIKLIFRNLISNALKYTDKGGRISVGLSLDRKTNLRASSKGTVSFTVSDTGYGIPLKATGKIFTKFFRAGNIVHKDTDGTGLGLYIVKTLLDYVGGRVSFTSEEGKGTTFTVLLPIEGMIEHEVYEASVGVSTRKGMLSAEREAHV